MQIESTLRISDLIPVSSFLLKNYNTFFPMDFLVYPPNRVTTHDDSLSAELLPN